jgi:hypothetical protein
MSDAYSLYLPSDFPDDLNKLLVDQSLHVTTTPKKIANGMIGSDHLISTGDKSMSILEAPPTKQCKKRYLLCLAKPTARDLLLNVISLLESFGARNMPE